MSNKRDEKTYANLSKVIQQFMKGKRYSPMGQVALIKRLKLPASLHPLCKKILAELVEKEIVIIEKKRYSLKKKKGEKEKVRTATLSGTLRLHPKGFGFVIPDNPALCPDDVFIPKHLTDNAVDGDRVEVTVAPDNGSEKGPEGKITAILERGRTHLAGTVRQIDAHGNALVHVPILGPSKPVLIEDAETLKVGERLIMKVLEWGEQSDPTLCEMTHKIGHITDPSTDIPAAIEEFDLSEKFPKGVIEEAKKFGKKVLAKDLKGRKDLTQLECFTIDPETARDFDDALSIRKTSKGHFQLGVHIADAAHYVASGSALDQEASLRCNSTYFPGACIPMLPEELCNNLCSLKADVIRLTVSVLMEFDPEGTLLKSKIVRGYIKSQKRFTYEEAKKVLDGKKKSTHAKALQLMVDLCLLLKKKRYSRGSVDFSLPDMVILVDKTGEPSGVKWVEYDISHQLVEEFMLKANEVVAKELAERGKPLLYRTHEEPSAENAEEFYAMARSLGFNLPEKPTTQEIQRLFEQAKNTPYNKQLSIGFIRSMKLAYYSPENVGHFGLALEHYTHFTSPIRRYCDMIIQRLLFDEEDEDLDLNRVALRCSDLERVSFRAETNVKVLKKLRLLKRYLQENPEREYIAIVTKIKPFGLYFEISELMLEGFLHISELENDYFVFDAKQNILFGKESGRVHKNGEAIHVSLISIDLILLEAKWELCTNSKRAPKKQKNQGYRQKKR
jgi:ribonuclease R